MSEFEQVADAIDSALSTIKNLQSRIAELEQALKFYANEKNWLPQEYWHDGVVKQTSYAIGKDGGAIARKALGAGGL